MSSLDFFIDSTLGNDVNDGRSTDTPWKTIERASVELFDPDTHIFLRRGAGVYRGQLIFQSSGEKDSPISFGAYGYGKNPIISGADIVYGWGNYSGNTWQVTLTSEPKQIFLDNDRLSKGADRDSLNDHEWVWHSGVLYLRDDTGNPDIIGTLIEASVRDSCIDWNDMDYVTVEDMICIKAGVNCLKVNGNGFGIKGVKASYSHDGSCILVWGSSSIDKGLIEGCDLSYSALTNGIYVGITAGEGPTGLRLLNNVVHHNAAHGIYMGLGSYHSLMGNICFANVDSGLKLNSTLECQVYRNHLFNNMFGMMLSSVDGPSAGHLIFNNLMVRNSHNGVVLTNDDGGACNDNQFYHNHLVNTSTPSTYRGNICFYQAGNVGNIFKNNIFYNGEGYGWLLRFPDSDEQKRQTFDSNIYYRAGISPGGDLVYDGTARDFAFWQGLGHEGRGSEADPLFIIDYSDLHLQVDSPCRSTGAYIGIADDYDGAIRSSPPAIGAYE